MKTENNSDKPLYTINDVPDGMYRASPVACGITKTEKGHIQFAIECAVKVPLDDGEFAVVNMTKFGGIETDEGMTYAMQDAENVGCDTSKPMEQWTVDPKITVVCKVLRDEYGVKLKSIFPDRPLEAGFLIKKMEIPAEEKEHHMNEVNARLAAIRAKRADGGTVGKTPSAPNGGGGESKKSTRRVPI